MGELLSLHGVGKSYRRGGRLLRVLVDASLEVGAGEVGAVVGSRDEGKTTLLKIAAGIETPDAGEVRLQERELTRLSDEQRSRLLGDEIAWTHRDGTGVKLKVLDYLALPLVLGRGHGRRQARELARRALERVGAAGSAERRWAELSDWEQVLVGLARGIVCEPRLLVVDSLIDGLGMRRTREANELLLSLVRELGCGVLMSASDLEAVLIADRVWSLERGQLGVLSEQAVTEAQIIEFPRPARADG
ncbi:MAG TPA: ATP-binding cassette domain-containing protein [Solirubrobacteraceae bacterium]|jgi:predicted ABC-type transport system involved in lysophospholipase L1 biosynthesis ATPase subunit|nr:ATP-binding cassette domain-containing protein [Solirubrobacteraceae bacterium]